MDGQLPEVLNKRLQVRFGNPCTPQSDVDRLQLPLGNQLPCLAGTDAQPFRHDGNRQQSGLGLHFTDRLYHFILHVHNLTSYEHGMALSLLKSIGVAQLFGLMHNLPSDRRPCRLCSL